jgi:hypothetical protein
MSQRPSTIQLCESTEDGHDYHHLAATALIALICWAVLGLLIQEI